MNCELRLDGCWGTATDTHHRKLRRHKDGSVLRLCVPCHRYIHDHPKESYERGWLVHSWDDTAEVPVT